ncbi:hypothetical protein CLV35_3368 [Motilibacter peucedani]|uniref:Uncharacterized protein n=1 Tax=Motilibacter peucedani TaxID=598650 RepID=A0A420XKK4_9ACTN|nr:hypothetical protein [Motilibacter peucedani]RKS69194.1 hypothetical protein CLV35_3368 [Motilibacter peucedani]
MDDLPLPPADRIADDHALLQLATWLAEDCAPGRGVVAVLCRPGPAAVGADDRAWDQQLRAQRRARVRGVFVAAGGTVRPLTLDDAA